jgi:hypothetical protein
VLPHAYELPAAVVLVLAGTLTCFAGYRLFKLVLGIYGFIIGAAFASSLVAASNTIGMIVAALVGGVAGAVLLVLGYFVGIALVGAGLGAFIMHAVWNELGKGDPPWPGVIILAVVGAIGAMFLQRYVIVVATAFGGAWTIIVGGLAAAGDRGAQRATDVFILYPFTPAPGATWVPLAWIVLGLIGTAVQLGLTGGKRR